MGASASSDDFEIPNKATVATLYYFAGRGLADQIRQGFIRKNFIVGVILERVMTVIHPWFINNMSHTDK
jgi:hypothetical protein